LVCDHIFQIVNTRIAIFFEEGQEQFNTTGKLSMAR
jgi:hypothetical protein